MAVLLFLVKKRKRVERERKKVVDKRVRMIIVNSSIVVVKRRKKMGFTLRKPNGKRPFSIFTFLKEYLPGFKYGMENKDPFLRKKRRKKNAKKTYLLTQ